MSLTRRGLLATAGAATFAGKSHARALPPGAVLVRAADLRPTNLPGLNAVRVLLPETPSRRRLLTARPDRSEAGIRLAALLRSGRGADNFGDLYDNRDGNHAAINPDNHPRVTMLRYGTELQARGLDRSVNTRFRFDRPTIGNASLAMTVGALWRSLPRIAMTIEPAATMQRVSALYNANHLYAHPEHRDHDTDFGDVFPALTPHWIISQGSSGSDLPFVRVCLDALAAMRPETKEALAQHGAIAPTLVMLLRTTQDGVDDLSDYLSSRAHPAAIDPGRIRRLRMIEAAQGLTPEALPPVVTIEVLEEESAVPRVGLLGDGLSERLFDTPEAVARIARGVSGQRLYRLRAHVAEPEGVTLHWTVLRGPGVSVTPEDGRGMTATAALPWIEPYLAPETGLRCNRADIAVVAVRRGVPSAPAFLSVSFPANRTGQWRPDGQPTIIDYRVAVDDGYIDPALHPDRDWRDTYRYDADGRLLGWRRERQGTRQDFTRHGLRVLEVDRAGRPLRAEQVGYPVAPRQGQAPRVIEEGLGRFRIYNYLHENDRLGTLRRAG